MIGLALLVIFGACVPSFAQDITGSLVGTVADPSGAMVANAKVTVFSTDRQREERTIMTDSSGNFAAPKLDIGKYRLTVEAPGFKRAIREGIDLNVNEALTFKIVLEVGAVSEEVTVKEAPIQVELQSYEQGTTVTGSQIRELGLITRNYEQLVSLMPGVSANNTDQLFVGNSLPSGLAATIPFSINGARNSASVWTIDGADNVDRGSNQTLENTPSVDALAEFRVQRSDYSAELGRAGGAQINVVTKSGTSQFHGDLYEFVRNDAFAANNYLNNATKVNLGADGTAKVPPLRWNNFGGTLGGPVYIPGHYNKDKNKTFFFFSEEDRRILQYSTPQAVIPTDAEKQGIFPHPVCVSYTGNTCNQTATQIAKIDPVAQQYLKDIFSKIPSGATGTNIVTSAYQSTFNFRQEMYKVDQIFGQALHVSVRYLTDSIPTVEPGGLFTGAAIPGVGITDTNSPGHNWVVRATSSFSPTWINEAGYNFTYGAIISDPVGLMNPKNSPDIKVPLPFPVTLNQVPGLSFTGGSGFTTFGQYRDFNRNHAFYDNMTKIVRSHTLKFGFSWNHYQKTENAGGANAGSFGFTSSTAQLPAGGATLFEQAFANFLQGNAASFSQASLDLTPNMLAQQWELYAQDDWRVKSNFTLSYGIRYSMFRQPIDGNNELTTFDPKLYNVANAPQMTAAGNIVPGTGNPLNGISVNGQTSPFGSKVSPENNNNWAPRVGFAWDPFKTGKTSIRGGYGVFYDATLFGTYEQNIFQNPPFVNSVSIPNTLLSNPLGGTPSVNAAPKVLHGTAADWKTPYMQQWSLDLQRQITNTLVVEAAFVGSKGTHLLGIVDINQAPPNLAYQSGLVPGNTTFTSANEPLINLIRPYRGYNAIGMIEPWMNSNYNSLQVSGTKRFSGDSQISFAYTWSKVLTNAGTDRSSAAQNTYNITGGEYGPAPFDRRQVFNVNFVYQIPFMKAQHGFAGKTLGGWQLSGIVYAMTGLPLTVTTAAGTDPAALGILGSSPSSPRPDLVCNPNEGGAGTRAQWYNTACFQNVAAGAQRPGNEGRSVLWGPGNQRWDLSLFKNIAFREDRIRFQLRGEAFNIWNHTNPNALGTTLGASTFGNITSYRDPRILQLGAKFYF